jgi:hypothetical protein
MPYEIREVPNGYKVFKQNEMKSFSKKPLTLEMARRQIRALYSAKGSEGSGLGDYWQKLFGSKYAYGKTTLKTLQEYGKYRIVELLVYRIPLSSTAILALNGATFGLWNKLKNEFGIDKFFHLSLVATLLTPSGLRNVIIEKNDIVNISTDYKTRAVTEIIRVPLGDCQVTLGSLIDDTLRAVGLRTFFEYDAFQNNCQWFIRYILRNNCQDLYTPSIAKFLFQDLREMVKRLPSYAQPLARAVTDFKAFTSRIQGKGKNEDQLLYLKFREALRQERK